jgi:hypothetical protein
VDCNLEIVSVNSPVTLALIHTYLQTGDGGETGTPFQWFAGDAGEIVQTVSEALWTFPTPS